MKTTTTTIIVREQVKDLFQKHLSEQRIGSMSGWVDKTMAEELVRCGKLNLDDAGNIIFPT